MLAHEKDLPGSWASEPPERWNMAELGGLHGKTLGLVGLGIPEAHGGGGLSALEATLLYEELGGALAPLPHFASAVLAAGALLRGGSEAQQAAWLPRIASGEVLPTAVFTEPNIGSDLASLKTRAVRDGDVYRITGQKTWITHPVRADMMTVLACS